MSEVEWEKRAAYIRKLTEVKELITREMDCAQLGDPTTSELPLGLALLGSAWQQYATEAGRVRG